MTTVAASEPMLARNATRTERNLTRLHSELLGPGGELARAEQAAQYGEEVKGDGRKEYGEMARLAVEIAATCQELANRPLPGEMR